MTDEPDGKATLYVADAIPVSRDPNEPRPGDPGTALTASVETIDNDRAANLRGVGVFG